MSGTNGRFCVSVFRYGNDATSADIANDEEWNEMRMLPWSYEND
jgi:hypothetical protein